MKVIQAVALTQIQIMNYSEIDVYEIMSIRSETEAVEEQGCKSYHT